VAAQYIGVSFLQDNRQVVKLEAACTVSDDQVCNQLQELDCKHAAVRCCQCLALSNAHAMINRDCDWLLVPGYAGPKSAVHRQTRGTVAADASILQPCSNAKLREILLIHRICYRAG
jgi:hypothetical protein